MEASLLRDETTGRRRQRVAFLLGLVGAVAAVGFCMCYWGAGGIATDAPMQAAVLKCELEPQECFCPNAEPVKEKDASGCERCRCLPVKAEVLTKPRDMWTESVSGLKDSWGKMGNALQRIKEASKDGAVLPAIKPDWLNEAPEHPKCEKKIGDVRISVFCDEQQVRLGVNEMGEKEPMVGGCAGTRFGCCPGNNQAASGPDNEGCCPEALCFCPEGVSVSFKNTNGCTECKCEVPEKEKEGCKMQCGTEVKDGFKGQGEGPGQECNTVKCIKGNVITLTRVMCPEAACPPIIGGMGGLPPPYLSGDVEAPAGIDKHDTWTARVYTDEQQKRLGVDKEGNPVAGEKPACPEALCLCPKGEQVAYSDPDSNGCKSCFCEAAAKDTEAKDAEVLGNTQTMASLKEWFKEQRDVVKGQVHEALGGAFPVAVDPPAKLRPKVAQVGEACKENVAPADQIRCKAGLYCKSLLQMPGASGTCSPFEVIEDKDLPTISLLPSPIKCPMPMCICPGDLEVVMKKEDAGPCETCSCEKRSKKACTMPCGTEVEDGYSGAGEGPECNKVKCSDGKLIPLTRMACSPKLRCPDKICCKALPVCPQGSEQVDTCDAGASCRKETLCCTTIMCQKLFPMLGGPGSLPPAWLSGDVEAPAGVQREGSYTMKVYTPEQQKRLHVDKMGNLVVTSVALPVPIVEPKIMGDQPAMVYDGMRRPTEIIPMVGGPGSLPPFLTACPDTMCYCPDSEIIYSTDDNDCPQCQCKKVDGPGCAKELCACQKEDTIKYDRDESGCEKCRCVPRGERQGKGKGRRGKGSQS